MELSLSYILEKIYTYGHKPTFKKYSNIYNFGCCICKEGSSFGRKKRSYYIVKDNYFCCHNCQKTWSPINWIKEVTGKSYREIEKEASTYSDTIDNILLKHKDTKLQTSKKTLTLPHDCINLTDKLQLQFYKDNKIVNDVLAYLNKRRLLTAINKPKTYYISLTDELHKNRLIIPFYDETGKIIFYQSRAVYSKDAQFTKYLSKINSEFSIFGIDRIDSKIEFLFLFEGPIDSMFVKNGLGLGGLRITNFQCTQLEKYRFHKKIWVLDNQFDNKDVVKKYQKLIDEGEQIFCVPEKFKQFKDLNEICVEFKLDQISPKFIIDNSYTEMQALMKLKI